MRLAVLLTSLVLAFALAIFATQSPRPRAVDAPAQLFSAERAMQDVRVIARSPHPLGSAEHVQVRNYLAQRLQELGFTVTEQSGPLTQKAVDRLKKAGGTPEAANFNAVNLIGVRPGKNPTLPPLILMAHYDTVVGSPGAADDTTGVAAILETARALEARDEPERDLVVVFTDAEEIGLEGARIFFSDHPQAKRGGFIVNLEARGGGGRAAMFETGNGNGDTIQAFAPVAAKVDGGVTSTSLAVFMYERMPNGTDFTHARDRGLSGLNFAFIGRAAQYHAADSTPENLDVGAVQHIGSQTLEIADQLSGAAPLPASSTNRVFSDLFGRYVLSHPLWFGWVLLGLCAIGMAVIIRRARRLTGLRWVQVGQGVLDGIWFLCTGFILLQSIRLLAGPAGDRAAASQDYYTLLRRLPWMEAGATMAMIAMMLLLLSGVRTHSKRIFGYSAAILGVVLALVMRENWALYLIPAAIAAALSLWAGGIGRTVWGSWIGILVLVFIAGCATQAFVPEAALIFTWPLTLGVITAVVSALITPSQSDFRFVIAPAVATVVGGAWLIGLGHFIFLGVGITWPGALSLIGLLVLLTARPMVPARSEQYMVGLALLLLLGAVVITGTSQLIEPAALVQNNLP